MQLGRARAQLVGADAQSLRHLVHFLVRFRQEFMQRRIEQADSDRQAGHDLEQLGEVLALHGQELGERRPPSLLGIGEDHLAHRDDALALEEHVLGAAEADALGAEGAGDARVGRRLGVGAHLHAPRRVRPAHQGREIAGHLGLHHRHRALHDLSRAAVDGENVALFQRHSAHGHRLARANRCGSRSTPETQGLPMPRATTAACEVMPPRVVTTPSAACMP